MDIDQKIGKSSKGSNPGERRGGRAKGVPNKKNAAKIAEIEASGLTPLDFMLKTMRSAPPDGLEGAPLLGWETMRFEAAKASAPYVHPKLANVEVTGKDGGPLQIKIIDFASMHQK